MAAVSYDFLNLIGYLSLGFAWAKMAGTSTRILEQGDGDGRQFHENKVRTARFYAAYQLPEIDTLISRISAGGAAILAVPESEF